MKALEFHTKIHEGIIQLPEKFKAWANAQVKIILLMEADTPLQDDAEINQLIAEIQARNPFRSIEDPIAWQNQLRDEWN